MCIESIISEIKEKCSSRATVVSVRKVPAYLAGFLRENRDIIFVHKMVGNTKGNKPTLQCDSADDTFNGDITGQPLEAPYSEFESMNFTNTFHLFLEDSESNSHLPLSLVEARSILAHCALYVKSSLPLYILTDASDYKKTLLLSLETNGGWITRSWVTEQRFKISPPLEELQARHSQFSKTPIHHATCVVRCTYSVVKEMLCDDPSLLHRSVALFVSWTKMSLEPPLLHHSTEIILSAKIRIGHVSGGLKMLWEQIRLLNEYLNVMSNIDEESCGVPMMPLPSSSKLLGCMKKTESSETLLSRVGVLMAEAGKRGSIMKTILPDSDVSFDKVINQYLVNDHPGTDITDKLWLLFIESKTYQQLSACIKELFMELKKKKAPPPFLSTSNISRLGRALLGDGGVSIHDPIEYLIEIGLEKLKKDILFIFSISKIATGNNLNLPKLPNFSEVSSVSWLSIAREWHLWLCKVYGVLEVLWNIQVSLGLTNAELYSIAPKILPQYLGEKSIFKCFGDLIDTPLQEIELPLPAKNVEKSIKTKPNEEWFLSFTTATAIRKFQSIFYKSPQNRFPNVFNTFNEDEDETLSLDPVLTYWYEFRSISELFSNKGQS